MILTQTLRKAVQFYPDKRAIVCGKRRWSYREFDERVTRLSRYLTDYGIRKGDKVALLLPNCHCFLEAYYGIAQIGAVSVPMNYRLSPQDIAFILEDSESKALIADPMFEKQVDPIRDRIHGVRILWTGEEKISRGAQDVNYEVELQKTPPDRMDSVPLSEEEVAQIY